MAGVLCLVGCPEEPSDPAALVAFYIQQLLSSTEQVTLFCSSDAAPCALAMNFSRALQDACIHIDYNWDSQHDSPRSEPSFPNMSIVSESYSTETEDTYSNRITSQVQIPCEGTSVVLLSMQVLDFIMHMYEAETHKAGVVFSYNSESGSIQLDASATKQQIAAFESKPPPKRSANLQPGSFPTLQKTILNTISQYFPLDHLSENAKSALQTRLSSALNHFSSKITSKCKAIIEEIESHYQTKLTDLIEECSEKEREVKSVLDNLTEAQIHLFSSIMEIMDKAEKMPNIRKDFDEFRNKLKTYEFTNREVLNVIQKIQSKEKKPAILIGNQVEDLDSDIIFTLNNRKMYIFEEVRLELQTSNPEEKKTVASDLKITPGVNKVKVNIGETAGKMSLSAYFREKLISDRLEMEIIKEKKQEIARPGLPLKPGVKPQVIGKPGTPKPTESVQTPAEEVKNAPKPSFGPPPFGRKISPNPLSSKSNPGSRDGESSDQSGITPKTLSEAAVKPNSSVDAGERKGINLFQGMKPVMKPVVEMKPQGSTQMTPPKFGPPKPVFGMGAPTASTAGTEKPGSLQPKPVFGMGLKPNFPPPVKQGLPKPPEPAQPVPTQGSTEEVKTVPPVKPVFPQQLPGKLAAKPVIPVPQAPKEAPAQYQETAQTSTAPSNPVAEVAKPAEVKPMPTPIKPLSLVPGQHLQSQIPPFKPNVKPPFETPEDDFDPTKFYLKPKVSKPNFPSVFSAALPKPGLKPPPFKPSVLANDPPAASPQSELTSDQLSKINAVRELMGEGFSSDTECKLHELLRTAEGQSLSAKELVDVVFKV